MTLTFNQTFEISTLKLFDLKTINFGTHVHTDKGKCSKIPGQLQMNLTLILRSNFQNYIAFAVNNLALE